MLESAATRVCSASSSDAGVEAELVAMSTSHRSPLCLTSTLMCGGAARGRRGCATTCVQRVKVLKNLNIISIEL